MRYLAALLLCTLAFSAFAQTPAEEVDVPVPAYDIARGQVLTEADLIYAPVPAARANAGIVKNLAMLTGMETRRALRAGEMIRTFDVKRPTFVAKGSNVTMLFETEGIRLTAVGRAMGEGAEGEVITILNPTSYRQVQGLVIAPGTVRVGPLRAAGGAAAPLP